MEYTVVIGGLEEFPFATIDLAYNFINECIADLSIYKIQMFNPYGESIYDWSEK